MLDKGLKSPSKGGFSTSLSDSEKTLVDAVSLERGLTVDEAASQLASEALARRVKNKTGRNPADNVVKFRRSN